MYIRGLKKKSQLLIFLSILAILAPLLFLISVNLWIIFLPLIPFIALFISHFVMKKIDSV